MEAQTCASRRGEGKERYGPQEGEGRHRCLCFDDNPAKYYDLIEKYKIEFVQFQHENLISNNITFPRFENTKWGIGITNNTSYDVIENFENVDFVLFMTTTPGVSGGTFNTSVFKKNCYLNT